MRSERAVDDDIVHARILVLGLIPDVVAIAIRQAGVLCVSAILWQGIDIRTDRQARANGIVIDIVRMVPPGVIVIPVAVIGLARFLIVTAAGFLIAPAAGLLIVAPARILSATGLWKLVVYMAAAAARPLWKVVIDMGTAR